MPTYIMLSTLTPEGVQTVKNNPQRIKEVNKEVEQIGAKVARPVGDAGPVRLRQRGRGARREDRCRRSRWSSARAARPTTSRCRRSRSTSSSSRSRTVGAASNIESDVGILDARAGHPDRLLPPPEPRDGGVVRQLRAADLHRLHGLHAGRDQVPRVRAPAAVGARAAEAGPRGAGRSPRPSSAGSRWASASCSCRASGCSSP